MVLSGVDPSMEERTQALELGVTECPVSFKGLVHSLVVESLGFGLHGRYYY